LRWWWPRGCVLPGRCHQHTAPLPHGNRDARVGRRDGRGDRHVEPVDTVEVGSQVTGTIKTLAADFNDIVKRGQVIATLDPASLDAQVQQAEASVRRLEADVESAGVEVKDAQQKQARAEALARDQLLAASDLDAARITTEVSRAALKSVEAQLVQARASLEQSRVNLGHTIITAPVDGIVLSRNVEVGQTVTASFETPTLFVIARDLATMQVNASVDEADIGRVKVGQPVRFHVVAYGDDEFSGTVSQVRLQPTVEQNVVSYTTEIDVPNTGLKLKPGMTATVSIEVAREEDALRVREVLRVLPSHAQKLTRAASWSCRGRPFCEVMVPNAELVGEVFGLLKFVRFSAL
jgi:HlyD family secretion protein